MKKSILAVCMLVLLSLLSCDINALNEMLSKAREKYVEESKKVKGLNSKDGNQEGEEAQEGEEEQADVVEQHMEEGVKEVVQAVPVDMNNEEIPVILSSPYYPNQEEIKIKEEDLVPSTNEEKEAQKEIEKVRSVLGVSGFAQLVEDARKLKSEYEQLESSFYGTLSELQNKIGSYPRKDRTERQKLIQLRNQLNEGRSHVDRFRIQVDSGLDERTSSKYFFEKAQDTLNEAIIKRLKSKLPRNRYLLRRGDSDLVARQALREAENALSQLESSSMKLIEAMGIKKEIEALIEEARSVLENLER
ncbi:P12 family lipoprotein (plasmid) [Borrelia miyamotoi]|nr:P12 family lipoprotein [Borrelia miyamotoi]WAZ71358.1 P12 family lipoprotein [Borrelia miyamotoi]